MSQDENKTPPAPETQHERWVKYGANVALVSLVVILLAALVIYGAQDRRVDIRSDLTAGRLYSLKPQTVNLIKSNTQPIQIVSLYTRKPVKSENEDEDEGQEDSATQASQYQAVADLLEEYSRKGNKIEYELIDPNEQPGKVEMLIERVAAKYGGEVKKYKAVCDEYPAVYDKISVIGKAQVEKMKALPRLQGTDENEDLIQTLTLSYVTAGGIPPRLQESKEAIDKGLKQRPPDYKGAADSVGQGMSLLSQLAGAAIDNFKKLKDDAKLPEAHRKYMAEGIAQFEQIKKLADDMDKKVKDLGELKLDSLKQSLKEKNTILVMGESDMRVINKRQVWQSADTRFSQPGSKPSKRFAGEQAITSAILGTTGKAKIKVAFVRPGGPPLTDAEIPGFREGGPLSVLAQRLRDYNFDIVEKDLSGMWAMQAQMRQQPAAPEPSDEEIKDAIWVVVDIPSGQRNPMAPPPSIAAKVAEHMKGGGATLVMAYPEADSLAEALDEWGVKLRTDAVVVHERIKAAVEETTGDMIEEAQRNPLIFVLREWGDHPLARPLASLDGVLLPAIPVQTEPKAGYQQARLIPIPQVVKAWGETDMSFMRGRTMKTPEYNPPKEGEKTGDIAPPLWAGAAVQSDKGSRLVVIGSVQFAFNDMVNFPDPKYPRQGVIRFPANGELFCNSIFWLAKMESMMALSPSAMEVNRISEISPAAFGFWRWGVLLTGLPGLVIVAGIMVYMARRD